MSNRIEDSGDISVQGVTYSKLLEEIGSPMNIDLMKIDIEGSEEAFICDLPDIFQHVERLVIEIHPNLCDAHRVMDTLHNQFHQISEIKDRISSKPLIYCYR